MPETQLMRCPACGVTNRVPQDKIAQGREPVCGRCKTPLLVSTRPVTVTDATFSAEVEHSSLPVLLDLWAAYGGIASAATA
jgi:thioredoxin 2